MYTRNREEERKGRSEEGKEEEKKKKRNWKVFFTFSIRINDWDVLSDTRSKTGICHETSEDCIFKYRLIQTTYSTKIHLEEVRRLQQGFIMFSSHVKTNYSVPLKHFILHYSNKILNRRSLLQIVIGSFQTFV